MNVTQTRKHCDSYPAAESTLHGHPSNVLVYSVGGKHFAYFKTSDPEKWRFSFRASPEQFLALTDIPGFKPARYMGRYHWVTVVDVQKVPEGFLKELIGWSYGKALKSLSKRRQAELSAETAGRKA